MAEVIGIATGLLSIIVFTFNACSKLYQTAQSITNHQQTILDLLAELGDFMTVLQNLQNTIEDDAIQLDELKGPLMSCGKACEDLDVAIGKCSSHSGGGKPSLLDWAKMQFKGNDVTAFQELIARYKSTIMIALCGANLRTVHATAVALDEYQAFIMKTVINLNKYFEDRDGKLHTLTASEAPLSDEDVSERDRLEKEMSTTKECLAICAKVFGDLDQVRLKIFEDICASHGLRQPSSTVRADVVSANRILVEGCEDWQGAVTRTAAQLQDHFFRVDSAPLIFPHGKVDSAGDTIEGRRARELDDSMRDCQKICAKAAKEVNEARTNIIENVSAAPDAFQAMVSTFGALLTLRNVKAGERAVQIGGQLSEASFQEAMRTAAKLGRNTARGEDYGASHAAQFGRYGAGHKLG